MILNYLPLIFDFLNIVNFLRFLSFFQETRFLGSPNFLDSAQNLAFLTFNIFPKYLKDKKDNPAKSPENIPSDVHHPNAEVETGKEPA